MNIYDAAKILGINNEITPEIVKQAYRKACLKYHPDRNPAGEEMMKAINNAYDALKNYTGSVSHEKADFGDSLNDAINFAINLPGVIVELADAWLWLTGDTRLHKDKLKEFRCNGEQFRWAPKKKAWYFRPSDYKSYSRGKYSLDEIREKHNSKIITRRQKQLNCA